jgi:hypothetical protein
MKGGIFMSCYVRTPLNGALMDKGWVLRILLCRLIVFSVIRYYLFLVPILPISSNIINHKFINSIF